MSTARKDDNGKFRYDLIPVEALRRLAEVYTIGSRKYSDRNWEKGLQWGRVYAALQRHANAWWGGERFDTVDGQEHLASVAWCAFALLEYERTHPELDDRPTTHLHIIKPTPEERNKILFETFKQGTDPDDSEIEKYMNGGEYGV